VTEVGTPSGQEPVEAAGDVVDGPWLTFERSRCREFGPPAQKPRPLLPQLLPRHGSNDDTIALNRAMHQRQACAIPPVPLVAPWTFADVHGGVPKYALSWGYIRTAHCTSTDVSVALVPRLIPRCVDDG